MVYDPPPPNFTPTAADSITSFLVDPSEMALFAEIAMQGIHFVATETATAINSLSFVLKAPGL